MEGAIMVKTLDGRLIGNMFLAGAARLNAEKDYINELNVFPVPDGDTGTNMSMTMLSAAGAVKELGDGGDIKELCKAIASGSLRGARGNSGVILSQILRGFTKTLAEAEEIDSKVLAAAMGRAVETAYKAVMKPKEGTILTVAKGMSLKAEEICEEVTDLCEFADMVIAHGEEVLSRTPDMLPVLKQAGVVDSGAQGLIFILKGANDHLQGRFPETDFDLSIKTGTTSSVAAAEETEIRFGYCTEFIIQLERSFNQKTEADLKAYLESIGDSIVCVSMDDIVKIHVHTNDPGLAIQRALKYGQLSCIKIDNMRQEHHERVLKSSELKKAGVKDIAGDNEDDAPAQEKKPYGFIAVATGEGMKAIFKDLGTDVVVTGGQTMNPSTEDMLNAISEVNARTVFILPNNKNIILAANQARDLTKDRQVIVLPTTALPQGIAALVAFDPETSAQDNESAMTEAASSVKSGQITYAVRDTLIDDKDIKQGDIMGIGDRSILAVGRDITGTTLDMIDEMTDEDTSLISIYYGEEISESDAGVLCDKVREQYPEADVELRSGGQSVYYYIVSVE